MKEEQEAIKKKEEAEIAAIEAEIALLRMVRNA